jgi:hypothetical protein
MGRRSQLCVAENALGSQIFVSVIGSFAVCRYLYFA